MSMSIGVYNPKNKTLKFSEDRVIEGFYIGREWTDLTELVVRAYEAGRAGSEDYLKTLCTDALFLESSNSGLLIDKKQMPGSTDRGFTIKIDAETQARHKELLTTYNVILERFDTLADESSIKELKEILMAAIKGDPNKGTAQ